MTDSGWQYPGQPGPYGGGAPPPPGGVPPSPPPAAPGVPPGAPGAPGAWNGIPGSAHDPAAVPWQQPDYSGGGAPPPEKRWPMVALFGAVVLLVVAIIGVAVTSGGGDDDTVTNADDTPSSTTEPDADDTPVTEPDDTEPDRPSEPTDPDAFVDDEAGFAISMPTSWAYTSLHGDADTAGERMFPDDADKASLVQQAAETLPQAIVFYGVVGDEVGSSFTTNVNINSTPMPGAEDLGYEEFAGEVRAGIDSVGATVTGDEPFTLAGVEGVRIEFDYDPSYNASGVQYSAVIDGELWVVNFASSDVDAYAEEFEAIAQSFEILG